MSKNSTSTDLDAPAKLPRKEKVPGHPGVYRHYRPSDKLGKPTGSYVTQAMVGMKMSKHGREVRDIITVTADTLRELNDRLEEEKAKRKQGLAVARKTQSLAAYLRDWLCTKYSLVDLAAGDFAPSRFDPIARERVPAAHYRAAYNYNGIIERHIIPAVGAYRLQEPPSYIPAIQKLVNTLAAEGKRRTAIMVCQTLSSALNDARQARLLSWDVMEAVKRPYYEAQSGAKEPLTADELSTLLDVAEAANDPLRALWHLSAATGCRPGELLGLHRNDVHLDDLNDASVTIRRRLILTHDRTPMFADDTKSGAKGNAQLAIDPDTAGALVAHLNRQAADRERLGDRYLDYGLVFCTAGGAPLIRRNIRRDFKKALTRAGITREVTFYALRHAHATLILENGGDIKHVQARLRHSNLTTLNTTYAFVRRAVDGHIARSVGAAIKRKKA